MVVYQVSKRFVDNEDSASDEATSIVYYALGIGHHTGIIDCFEERLRCPMSVFADVLSRIAVNPADSIEVDVLDVVKDGAIRETVGIETATSVAFLASKLRQAYERGEVYIDKYDLKSLTEGIDAVLGNADPHRNLPLDELPDPEELQVDDPNRWLEEFRILLDRMMAGWDASLIIRRRG